MADTRISKIQIRRGTIADLPILSPGEFGYATDTQRLFLGNEEYTVGTGNAAQTVFQVPTGVDYPLTSSNITNPALYLDSTLINAASYTVAGTTITFGSPPAAGTITMKFNSELATVNDTVRPGNLQLAASASAGTATGFGFDTSIYDTAFVDYSIKLSGGTGYRIGQLRLLIDSTAGTVYIDDQYNTLTANVDVTFAGNISGSDFSLTYTNNETATATLYYTFKLWKM
jgi:hypothetical protein|tara:strand:- start:833 stop:1519 length:687 start_codon:yes stop_codon:yes gene_type:complete